MTAVEDRDSATCAYVLVIEGIDPVFCNDEAVTSGSWGSGQEDSPDVHHGLELPSDLTTETNLRTGAMPTNSVSFVLHEVSGTTLASTFGGTFEETDPIATTLEPGATAPLAQRSKHIGIEYTDSGGARGQYPCVPGFNRPHRHVGQDQHNPGHHDVARMSSSPVVMAGRRFTFWRLYLQDDGTYENLADTSPIYWGTLTGGGSQQGQTWTLEADGPHSWLERPLGTHTWGSALPCWPAVVLDDDERLAYGKIYLKRLNNIANEAIYGGLEDDDALSASITFDQAITDLNTFLDTLRATEFLPAYGTFDSSTSHGEEDMFFSAGDGRFVSKFWNNYVDDDLTDTAYIDIQITLHIKVWRLLGYDPEQQVQEDPKNSLYWVRFAEAPQWPGYWNAFFTSRTRKWFQGYNDDEQDWGGIDEGIEAGRGSREHRPLYDQGVPSFQEGGDQDFYVWTSGDYLYQRGQLTLPPADDPSLPPGTAYSLDGADVTDQGLFVFYGQIFPAGATEPEDTVQVARCSWRLNASGAITQHDDTSAQLYVDKWLDPRAFHLPYRKFKGSWPAPMTGDHQIRCMPLAELAYHNSTGDMATNVIRRLLLTTGTATGWYTDGGFGTPAFGTGGEYVLETGSNNISGGIAKDAEIETMGLAIPSSMVAGVEVWDQANEPIGNKLRYTKETFPDSRSSADLLQGILAPRGWAWSLRDRKYGVFDPSRLVMPDDVDVVLTVENYHNPRMAPTMQRQRIHGPISAVEVACSLHPIDGSTQHKHRFDSNDPNALYLANGVVHSIEANGLISPDNIPTGGQWWSWARWTSDFDLRWSSLCKFWARRHMPVRLKLHARDAADLWPGSRVMLTDSSVYDPAARSYGITGMTGYCYSRSEDVQEESVTVEILLHADSANSNLRMYAPSARVWAYDANDSGSGHILMCRDDYRAFRGATLDVTRFAEGANTSHGGSALLELFQYDRTGWTGGIYGTVSSVNSVEADSYIVLTGALTGGTFYKDKPTIVVLRNWDNQSAAWVTALHAPICDENGEVSAVAGKKFNGQ